MLVCAVRVMKVCVGLCGDVGESGAHSLVDLVGIKVKRNVSKLLTAQTDGWWTLGFM